MGRTDPINSVLHESYDRFIPIWSRRCVRRLNRLAPSTPARAT
ncbi:hypothetical protein BZL30_5045 [Mycobacterium kansasii]|uniref:Uncharacterized protein n=1 Tax=Mycobacterium kansasii TaxID=1768 RepID=A0A1V3X2Q0_MYCKA|nr:hypothetical protein BZL30_5045 [Mycobacterium kansasii]